MNGYQGQILHLDLTRREYSAIDTEKYIDWGGGHGLGSAVFWDLCKDKDLANMRGIDPENVVTLMTSPLSGTLVPSASGRVEVQGIGYQQYPVNWFTRSNFGGRFGGQLKYAGWDGIVVEGKADTPTWVEITDGEVAFRDAGDLWGKDTQDTQKAIWDVQSEELLGLHGWTELGGRDTGRSSQRSAIVTIGPAGENLSAFGCLIHDAGNASGQCGFGAVFGSKNLKAISVLGTGSISIADPGALLQARLAAKELYAQQPDAPLSEAGVLGVGFGAPPKPSLFCPPPPGASGPQSCQGCINGCRARWESAIANESSCQETGCYVVFDVIAHGQPTDASIQATDLVQRYGVNSYETEGCLKYLLSLNMKGLLGAGKAINTSLNMDRLGEVDFIKDFLDMVAYRKDIGEDLAEGTVRASIKWGRYEEDSADGSLGFPYWGMVEHGYDSRAEIEWGYGSIVGDRDINEHCFNWLMWESFVSIGMTGAPSFSAEEFAKIATDKMAPYAGDMKMLDYGTPNLYSEHIAKLVAWHRHYSRFWKQSALYCDFRYPDFINFHRGDKIGLSGQMEHEFWNAVTGGDMTWEKGIEIGRRIWNLDNAIWTLQGRHRDMAKFAKYVYLHPAEEWHMGSFYPMPVQDEAGQWQYANVMGRNLDEAGVEEWKTLFYKLEGWDAQTGWPTRATLEALELPEVADKLESVQKLGAA